MFGKKKSIIISLVIIFTVFCAGFILGFRNGLGKNFPYGVFSKYNKIVAEYPGIFKKGTILGDLFAVSEIASSCYDDNCLLNTAFTDEVKTSYFIYPAIEHFTQTKDYLETYMIPIYDFDEIKNHFNEFTYSEYPIIPSKSHYLSRLSFILKDDKKIVDTYCFKIHNTAHKNANKIGFLIIPGSGNNQSIEMLTNQNNYQYGIAQTLSKYGDTYVYIKPNEDILSITSKHNNKKLNYGHIINYLLNRGYSYSYLYLVQTIAWGNFLNKKYDFLGIFGLSQGGLAALICGIQTNPDLLFCASGFSVLNQYLEYSSHGQIILTNSYFRKLTDEKYLADVLSKLESELCLSYGKYDEHSYAFEYSQKVTQKYFQNATIKGHFIYHQGGHNYPLSQIDSIISAVSLKYRSN